MFSFFRYMNLLEDDSGPFTIISRRGDTSKTPNYEYNKTLGTILDLLKDATSKGVINSFKYLEDQNHDIHDIKSNELDINDLLEIQHYLENSEAKEPSEKAVNLLSGYFTHPHPQQKKILVENYFKPPYPKITGNFLKQLHDVVHEKKDEKEKKEEKNSEKKEKAKKTADQLVTFIKDKKLEIEQHIFADRRVGNHPVTIYLSEENNYPEVVTLLLALEEKLKPLPTQEGSLSIADLTLPVLSHISFRQDLLNGQSKPIDMYDATQSQLESLRDQAKQCPVYTNLLADDRIASLSKTQEKLKNLTAEIKEMKDKQPRSPSKPFS